MTESATVPVDPAAAGQRRCITCLAVYPAGDPAIHTTLLRFEESCICRRCVAAYDAAGGPIATLAPRDAH